MTAARGNIHARQPDRGQSAEAILALGTEWIFSIYTDRR